MRALGGADGGALRLTGATDPTRYVGGTVTGAPTTGTFAVGDFVIAEDGVVWICTVAGTPGTWVSASGLSQAAGDARYARLGAANKFMANQLVSTDGSSTTTPVQLGFTDFTSGEAARIPFGDNNSAFQIGNGFRPQLYAYDTLEIRGQRRLGSAPAFVAAISSTPGVIVINEQPSVVGLQLQAAASQAGNILEAVKNDGTVYSTISENGYFTTRKTAAPADAELSNSEVAYWLDATPGAVAFNIKAKDSAGTVVSDILARLAASNTFTGTTTLGSGGTGITKHLSATATLDFGNILAAAAADLTVTVTGAAVGDSCYAAPSTTIESGVIWNAWVSAADTVTIRANNAGAVAVDPASRSWRVDVWKH